MQIRIKALMATCFVCAVIAAMWHYHQRSLYSSHRLRKMGVEVNGPSKCIEWGEGPNWCIDRNKVNIHQLHDCEVVDVAFRQPEFKSEYLELIQRFHNLQALTVRFSHVPSELVDVIVKMEHLRVVDVEHTDFGDSDLVKLVELSSSQQLKMVFVEDTKVTYECADRCRKLRPNLLILFEY